MLPNHDLERMIRARLHLMANAIFNKPTWHLPQQKRHTEPAGVPGQRECNMMVMQRC
jgi:hypothetical protein